MKLNKLSPQELDEFKSHIELKKSECVEMIREVLKKMNRTDLAQMSAISSGTRGEAQRKN